MKKVATFLQILIIPLSICIGAHATVPCEYPFISQSSPHWDQSRLIKVNISPNFSPEEQQAIQTAFQQWQNANTSVLGNCSGVTFTFISQSGVIAAPPTFLPENDAWQLNKATPGGGTVAETGEFRIPGTILRGRSRAVVTGGCEVAIMVQRLFYFQYMPESRFSRGEVHSANLDGN